MKKRKKLKRSLDPMPGDLVSIYVPMYGIIGDLKLKGMKGRYLYCVVINEKENFKAKAKGVNNTDYNEIYLLAAGLGTIVLQLWEYYDCDPRLIQSFS